MNTPKPMNNYPKIIIQFFMLVCYTNIIHVLYAHEANLKSASANIIMSPIVLS